MDTLSRRRFVAASAAGLAATALASNTPAAQPPAGPDGRMGVAITSYGARWGAKPASEKFPAWKDALDVLDHCARLGAGGLQIGMRGWQADFAGKVRERREALGLYLEGQIRLPKSDADAEQFESEVKAGKEAGATVFRTAAGNRRYEDFDSAEGFREFARNAWRGLTLAEPVVRRHGVKLAVENHKDWRVPDLLDILKRLASEHVGVTLDTGNSIALLEDPNEVVSALAPFAMSVHLKDMGMREYDQGFLLSEVPLGQGLLDLPAVVATIRRASPAVRFSLEMITRDPLRVPCLTEKYWASLADVPGRDLSRTLVLARTRGAPSERDLPHVTGLTAEQRVAFEEDNVRKCFAHARAKLSL